MSIATFLLRTLMLALLAGLSLPLAAQTQTPFSGTPIPLPGTFEAENFDNGGEGVAYHDNVPGNAGSTPPYRATDVDIIVSRDPAGGGFVVNNFETGEWLEYTVNIQAAGQYEIALRVASGTFTGAFRVEIDNNNVTGTVTVPPTGDFGTFAWVAKRGVSLPAGQHVLKLVSEQQYFDVNQIRVTSTPTTPFAGVIPLPGTFEAENFDNGGQDVAYSDTTAANDGGQFRTSEGVDIITSRDPDDAGSGFGVNGFHAGEWMVYTVSVANSGLYDIEARVATGTFSNAAIHVEIDGVNVTGSMSPGATGNFGTYTWVKKPSVQLSAGQHVLKLVSDQEIADVNRIRVTAVTHTPFSGTPIPLPGTFEAENFDNGGEGNAYHDNVAGNAGGQYRTNESVDIIASPDSAGGTYVVNNFETGEWLLYTVNIAAAVQYDIDLRLASGATSSAKFHVEIDEVNVTGTVNVPATGSFGTYAWIGKKNVQLPAGVHTLKIVSEQQYFDVNQVRVQESTTPSANPPQLLFRSGFEAGVSVGAPYDCYEFGCWQNLLGTDSISGFTWPPRIAGGDGAFQARSGVASTATTLSDYIVNDFQTVTGHTGAPTRALHALIKQNSCTGTAPQGGCATQDPYLLRPASEPGDMYISFWRKLDPQFLQKVVETWHVVFEWKTVGAPEDYRVVVGILTYGGTPYWDIVGDADCWPCDPFWRVNNQFPVPVGEWFKFEVFWHRAPNSNDNTGRVWVAVNGTVIADVTNGNTTAGVPVEPPAPPWNTSMMGVNGNHIDRIFLAQLYSGGSYPLEQWTDDVQIWTKIPVEGVDAKPGDPWFDPPYGMHVP